MVSEISNILRTLKKRGLLFAWDYFSQSIWFDLRNGTSTAARVAKDQQTIHSNSSERENGVLYVASFTCVTTRTVAVAGDILGPHRMRVAQFMDLGCGKGKALLVYALYFGADVEYAALGIEYDSILANQARANVEKLPFTKRRVDIITDSATNIRSHLKSKLAIIYLYNPFHGETLRATLSALQGLPHVLIYVDPLERKMLSDFGYCVVAEQQGRYNADTWLVARSADLEQKVS
jgi:hypothetical protein